MDKRAGDFHCHPGRGDCNRSTADAIHPHEAGAKLHLKIAERLLFKKDVKILMRRSINSSYDTWIVLSNIFFIIGLIVSLDNLINSSFI